MQYQIVRVLDTNTKICVKNGTVYLLEKTSLKHQPQLGPFRTVTDPQALKDARPPQDVVQERSVNWGWNPVGQKYNFGLTPNPLVSTGSVGTVTVVIT